MAFGQVCDAWGRGDAVCCGYSRGEGIHRAGYTPARYFLLAWISFLVGILVFALKTFGILPLHSLQNLRFRLVLRLK